MEGFNVMNAPKTATFQMRINPQVKDKAEQIFANCGLTLTDAINVFLQQSMNVEGLPFVVTQSSGEALKSQAIAQLMSEIKAGRDSVKSESDWISEEEMRTHFGIRK
ncbi:MAG: type II toxin-antitoxin system RelB/DinJ family antitoxin [Clostridia bacterium]